MVTILLWLNNFRCTCIIVISIKGNPFPISHHVEFLRKVEKFFEQNLRIESFATFLIC